MLRAVPDVATNSLRFRPAAFSESQDIGHKPWTKLPPDGVVYPPLSRTNRVRMMTPLTAFEQRQAAQLAQDMRPRRGASPYFDATRPSELIGPSSNTRYSVTCCPMNRADVHGRKFSVDDLLDQAAKTGAKTTISLTSVGDARHSAYYRQNMDSRTHSITSFGRPAFTTSVLDVRGQPVKLSIFKNTVRNNVTGKIEYMKMVHIDGWRDQTALSADTQISLIAQLRDQLSNEDLRSVLVHCSEGRNRTGSFLSMLEGMDAVAKGQPADLGSKLQWFRNGRVADAVAVPEQLNQLAQSEIRMNRVTAPARRP